MITRLLSRGGLSILTAIVLTCAAAQRAGAQTPDPKLPATDQTKQSDTPQAPKALTQGQWGALTPHELLERVQTGEFPTTSQMDRNALPGGKEVTVTIRGAAASANNVYYASFVGDKKQFRAFPSPEQKAGAENTLLKLEVPDPGFSWGTEQRELILVSLAREVDAKTAESKLNPVFAIRQTIALSNRWFCTGVAVAAVICGYLLAVWALGRFSGKYSFSPVFLTAGAQGKASLSKLQAFGFSLLVLGLLVFIWLRHGVLSDISSDVLLLLGISAAGATGSSIADAIKARLSLDNWSWLRNHQWLTGDEGPDRAADPAAAKWSDLLKADDGSFDIYRFQLITVSLVVGGALVTSDLTALASYALPPNILALLGLSNVVYIGGKAVGPSVAEINEKLSAVRSAERVWVAETTNAVAQLADQTAKQKHAIQAAPEKYQSYISLAREAARMIQARYGSESKFRAAIINDTELMPVFP